MRPPGLAALLACCTSCASASQTSPPWPLPAVAASSAPPRRLPAHAAAAAPTTRPAPEITKPPSDTDGDSIDDARDGCPITLETRNGFQDLDGCPDELPGELARALRMYHFNTPEMATIARTGRPSARLRARLEALAALMSKYPDIRVEIVWHTDATDEPTYSMEHDKRSAEVVRTFLSESLGVAPDRIEARGAGPGEPVDTNKTAPGRAHNRRVEFNLVAPGSPSMECIECARNRRQ